ncbi:hypothetical protein AB0O20_07615 [Streptomyces kronopolitis]|uniref:hypothetical protein n=1 Tax=Streptomyces kronopolitis TaxID=1612435 RepID=UPI00342F3786
MPTPDTAPEQGAPLHVEIVRDGVPTPFDAEEVRVTLPNGIVFRLYPGQDPAGSVVADLPCGGPDTDEFAAFVLRPGASNLFLINAERHGRRTAQEGG